MAWNNQSGGPWGAGGKNPTLPDLEELLRRSQDRLKTVLPGGLGGKGLLLVGLVEEELASKSGRIGSTASTLPPLGAPHAIFRHA